MIIQFLIDDLDRQLRAFEIDYETLTLRGKVLRLVDVLKTGREISKTVMLESGCTEEDGRERILFYMTQHVGEVIDAIELEVVSGISEYARRVRELRVEFGYRILTGKSNDPSTGISLKPSQYLLIDPDPDRDSAYRWRVANDIRRQKAAARDKLLHYLQVNVGRIVTSEELAYVANISDWPRRVRELRTEEGFAIATRFTGRPDLRSGEYVLESDQRIAERHDRRIPTEVQVAVYTRDRNICRICGGTFGAWTRPASSMLEIHHIQHHVHGGTNLADNLLVLCNACHDDVHAGRRSLPDGSFDPIN